MNTKYKISIIVIITLIVAVTYFVDTPFSITQHLILSTFHSPLLQEFEELDEIELLRVHYNVTRTIEHFNTIQSHFTKFYFIEPNGAGVHSMMNLVVIRDLITGQTHMIGMCLPGNSEGYRLEQKQVLPYLQKYHCFEDIDLTQKILDKTIPPFSIMYRGGDEIFDDDKIVDVVIPIGISDSEKINLNPSIVTVVIGENNTIRWTNQDNTSSTLYSDEPKWTTGIIKPGNAAILTFNEPGVYEYNGYNHSWKKGKIIVLEE